MCWRSGEFFGSRVLFPEYSSYAFSTLSEKKVPQGTILLQIGSRAFGTFKSADDQNLWQVEGSGCEPPSRTKVPALQRCRQGPISYIRVITLGTSEQSLTILATFSFEHFHYLGNIHACTLYRLINYFYIGFLMSYSIVFFYSCFNQSITIMNKIDYTVLLQAEMNYFQLIIALSVDITQNLYI